MFVFNWQPLNGASLIPSQRNRSIYEEKRESIQWIRKHRRKKINGKAWAFQTDFIRIFKSMLPPPCVAKRRKTHSHILNRYTHTRTQSKYSLYSQLTDIFLESLFREFILLNLANVLRVQQLEYSIEIIKTFSFHCFMCVIRGGG